MGVATLAANVSDGPPIAFDEAGAGSEVVFVHGALTDGGLWRAVAQLLAPHHRAICCHLRGHGRTAAPPMRASKDHVADLLALLDWMHLSGAHVVSHGAGWAVAAGLAVRAPHRVRSLAIIDPVVPRAEKSGAIQEAWHLEMLLQWLSVAHGSTVSRPEHVAALREVVAQQTHVRLDERSAAAPAVALMGCPVPQLDLLRCPVISMVGEQADRESRALAESLFGAVRGVWLAPVPGATRRSPIEAPDTVAALLTAFLRTHTP
jgi:pimeloyl-ACP methyl ester carboxylesterase